MNIFKKFAFSIMIVSWRNLASGAIFSAALIFGALAFINSTFAHEVRPIIVDLRTAKDASFTLSMKINLEAYLAGIGVEHADTDDDPNAKRYDELRKNEPAQLRELFVSRARDFITTIHLRFDDKVAVLKFDAIEIPAIGDTDLARDSFVNLSGKIPPNATSMRWALSEGMGASVFRFSENSGGVDQSEPIATYVATGATSKVIAVKAPEPIGAFATFTEYVFVGFDHIVPKGLDHILFVVGLFLLSTRLAPLLWQVTSFTVAHTVTLALGMLGIITIPANIVEPLIAASIVYVAVENIFMSTLSPWRPVLVFLFGLLHGLGFAGVLSEFGLSSENFISGLIGFNVGVELGQLAVIAVGFILVGIWFGNKEWYRKAIVIPGSLIIAVIGSYWFYERVFLT